MTGLLTKRRHIPQHTYKGRVQRDARIDNVRGMLIILVVIGHFLLPLLWSDTRLIDGIVYLIYVFHMPCFVMLSGYYAKGIIAEGRFRWGKIVQMLWLYFVFEAVVYITEGMNYGYASLPGRFIYESGAPWYLMSLATWYLTVPVFGRFRGKRSSAVVVAVMFAAVAFMKYVINISCLFSFDRTLSFFPFFYAGYYTSQRDLDKYLMSFGSRWIEAAAAVLCLAVLFGAKGPMMKYNLIVYGADYSRFSEELYGSLWAVYLIWCCIAMIISLGLIGVMLNRRMAVITELGKNTLQIYFLHRPIRDIMEYCGLYQAADPFNRLHVLLLILFSIFLTVILGSGIISGWFGLLRTVFDPLLEKHNAL